MNKKMEERLVEISKALKMQKNSGKSFHVSFALMHNRIICIGWNDYNKGHSVKKFGKYKNYKEFPSEYRPSRHSETHLIIKLGEECLKNYEIVNVRIGSDGNPAMAAPCKNCLESVLLPYGAKNIFYTNTGGEFIKLRNY
jgi:hypothetical protein